MPRTTIVVPCPGHGAAPPGCRPAAPPSRYAAWWDEYSDFWDREQYFRQFQHLGDEWGPDDHVRHVIDSYVRPYLTPASRVLEIGPGGGRYTALLLEHCAALLGVDASARMVERLRRRFAAEPRATFVQGSGHELAAVPDGAIDFACAFNVFVQIEVEDVYGYLLELARVMRPGGHAALHYADFSNPEGFRYFTAQRTTWIRDFGKRGRFCELTLATMAMLAERAGLTAVRNQYVGRDSVVVVRAGGPAAGVPAVTRRDFAQIERTLDALAADVYQEAPTSHHAAAAHATALELLAGLPIRSAIELGCGSAPTLDWLAARGVATTGVSLGAEPCRHAVVAADMQFSGLPAGSADLVVARHALEHSPMPLLLLFEIARLSRRWALVVVPCDEQIWIDWPNHYSVFGKPMWRRLFARAGFRIVRELDGPLLPASTEWCFLLEKDG